MIMKMYKSALVSVVVWTLLCPFAFGQSSPQPRNFDIATFTPPQGWTAEDRGDSFAMTKIEGTSYAILVVYRSVKSSGGVQADFKSAWQTHAVARMGVKQVPKQEPPQKSEGWDIVLGTAPGENEGGQFAQLLSTASGFGKSMSVAAIVAGDAYLPQIDAFLGSLKLDANAAVGPSGGNEPVKESAVRRSAAQPAASAGGGTSGISTSTTTFEDGWISTIQDDYVVVVREGMNLYLFFPIQITPQMANGDLADDMWNAVVVPRFRPRTAQKFEDAIPDMLERLYYYEGTGTDPASGRTGFIAMKAVAQGGILKRYRRGGRQPGGLQSRISGTEGIDEDAGGEPLRRHRGRPRGQMEKLLRSSGGLLQHQHRQLRRHGDRRVQRRIHVRPERHL